MKKSTLIFAGLIVFLSACNETSKVPSDLVNAIKQSYEQGDEKSLTEKGLFKRKPKLSELKEPTETDTTKLPSWITNKKYISENADALKYAPSLLIGALARTYEDGRFDIYSVTYNIRFDNDLPEISKIEKPTNFYEQTYDNSTRFNTDFIIGGITIQSDEIVKITYTETNYGNLEKYDQQKLNNLRKEIEKIPNAKLSDWSIVRGVVILDCTSTKNRKTDANANVKASWLTSGGSFYMQTGNTDNFRLVSIDLENLFLQP